MVETAVLLTTGTGIRDDRLKSFTVPAVVHCANNEIFALTLVIVAPPEYAVPVPLAFVFQPEKL